MSQARKFFIDYVMPFVREWADDPTNMRLAFAAAMFLSHTGDWYKRESNVSLSQLERDCADYELIRAVSNAAKHLKLEPRRDGSDPIIGGADNVKANSYWSKDYWAKDHFHRHWWAAGIVIELNDGTTRDFGPVVDAVVAMWEQRFGFDRAPPLSSSV